MAKLRTNLDDRSVTLLENRMLMCERLDGEHRLISYLATSDRGTFLAFVNWPDGEAYQNCTFTTQKVRRKEGFWGTGPWTLRAVTHMDDEEILDGFRLLDYEKTNSINFEARMDEAGCVLEQHEF